MSTYISISHHKIVGVNLVQMKMNTKTQRAMLTTKDAKVYYFVPRNLCVFVSLCSIKNVAQLLIEQSLVIIFYGNEFQKMTPR